MGCDAAVAVVDPAAPELLGLGARLSFTHLRLELGRLVSTRALSPLCTGHDYYYLQVFSALLRLVTLWAEWAVPSQCWVEPLGCRVVYPLLTRDMCRGGWSVCGGRFWVRADAVTAGLDDEATATTL